MSNEPKPKFTIDLGETPTHIYRRMDTPENRAYWASVDRVAAEARAIRSLGVNREPPEERDTAAVAMREWAKHLRILADDIDVNAAALERR